MKIGMKGEVRLIARDTNTNEIVSDTGYHSNLVLDNGLNALGNDGQDWFTALSVGTGSSEPEKSQTQLDAFVAKTTTKELFSHQVDRYEDSEGYYEIYAEYLYTFEDMGAQSIAEVGLTLADDTLATRALVKHPDGEVQAFNIKAGQQLQVFYKIYQRFDTADIINQINVSDGQGSVKAYQTTARLMYIGQRYTYYYAFNPNLIGKSLSFVLTLNFRSGSSSHELKVFNENPDISKSFSSTSFGDYVVNSFKRVAKLNAGYAEHNYDDGIRKVSLITTMGSWQIQFDSVDGNLPLQKTSQHKLTIPVEFNWGRIETEVAEQP
ncbi:hypothetical protein [Psychrobacter sp. I-STPA10]|uniref:hypothetical protein n=1 Tax=Psychrobacter sp. I-STPA10 TaxID=2585769 RepID=UPI001E36AD56|nr:hypothetical protein [Psychrobacter sp. I-STPA10]